MKLAHFADLHLDSAFKWAPPDASRLRRSALRTVLARIADVARAESVDALLCGGDLYEQENWTPDTAAYLAETFRDLSPIRVFLAPGNHDWLGPTSLYRQTRWSDNVHLFTEAVLKPVELADGVTLWGAAHRAPAGTESFLDRFDTRRDGINLALFHGTERFGLFAEEDGKQPHAPFDADDIPAKGLMHAFCGHFHSPKIGEFHTYPGNPEPLTFGERGERGLVIAALNNAGHLERSWRKVSETIVQDIEADITGCTNAAQVRSRVADVIAGHTGIARVVVQGEVAKSLDFRLDDLRSLRGRLDAAVFVAGELRSGRDLDAIAGEPTVRGQFVRDILESALSAEEQRRVIETGLRALEGRRDLEVV